MVMIQFATVRSRVGGLRGVITKLGDAPSHEAQWKNFPQCPFCGRKQCAGVFEKNGAEFFKCHHRDCNTGGRVVAEVGYIGLRKGLAESKPAAGGPSPAYEFLLRLAGCWEENQTPTGPNGRTGTPTQPENPAAPDETHYDEAPAEQPPEIGEPPAWEMILPDEGTADTHPSGQGPSPVGCPPEMSGSLEDGSLAPSDSAPGPTGAGESAGSTGPSQLIPSEPASEQAGPAAPPPPPSVAAGDSVAVEPAPGRTAAAAGTPGPVIQTPTRPEKPTALEWFFEQLEPVDWELKPVQEDGSPLPENPTAEMMQRVRYQKVSLFDKRGLLPQTCAALELRRNDPERNEAVLEELRERFEWLECVESGLWLPEDRKRELPARPNPQFCGLGQVAKKPKSGRKHKDDKWYWGRCCPTLIPYFNAAGKLVKLRPHKGGAPADTEANSEHIYVPRRREGGRVAGERFQTVVVCEGEYKAGALWQEVGPGWTWRWQEARPEVGACALPGISFVRNLAYVSELRWWLKAVDARRVIVAFDSEEKPGKALEERLDTKLYARYLAVWLQRKAHLDARVLELPAEWRNSKGKADWDGALASLWAKERRGA